MSGAWEILRRTVLVVAGVLGGLILLAVLAVVVLTMVDLEGPDTRAATHLTIYVARPLLDTGGALIVAGRTLPEDAWRRLGGGPNPAAGDADNPKRAQVKPGDRHFGVAVSAPVTVVEFFYPEGGTYSFNLRLAPDERARGADAASLRTERVSIGSASLMTDPEGGALLEWPSMSVIAVHGPGRDAGWARLASHTYTGAFEEPLAIMRYEGARTIALSEAQVQAHVRDVEPDEPAPAQAEPPR